MKNILKIVICIILLYVLVTEASEEWILGQPEQTDTTNYEWILGSPFVYTEEVAGVVVTPYYYRN